MQYGRCTVFVGAHSRLGRNFRLSLHRYLARRRASKHLPRRLDSGESALWVTPMEVAAKVAFSFKKDRQAGRMDQRTSHAGFRGEGNFTRTTGGGYSRHLVALNIC